MDFIINFKGTEIISEFLNGFVGITQDNKTASIKPIMKMIYHQLKLQKMRLLFVLTKSITEIT